MLPRNHTAGEAARFWRNLGNEALAEACDRLDLAEKKIEFVKALVNEMFSGQMESDDLLVAIKKCLDSE